MIIKFSGDSGDGMQLVGTIFSNIVSKMGYEVRTSPSYPADMRPTKNTEQGVSSFQVHFDEHVSETGEDVDILVCMNQAAYNVCKQDVSPTGVIIYDKEYPIDITDDFNGMLWQLPITEQCKFMGVIKSRNIYVLGCLCYYLDIPQDIILDEITKKFSKKPNIAEVNRDVLMKSFDFCYNLCIEKKKVLWRASKQQDSSRLELLDGCTAVVKGIKLAADTIGRDLFCASYPITPATNILVNCESMRKQGVKAVQAEDEIAACCMAIGASYAGDVAITSTSGPGMCLKSEAINLAVMAEIPLVIIDVMRGGPSTGMPTKTEQSDLNIALYGRSGDSPLPVIAATSPSDCYSKGYDAVKMTVENCTPVILLMDASIGNGLEMTDLSQEFDEIKPSAQWRNPGTDTEPVVLGGSEVDSTFTISTNAENRSIKHVHRIAKINSIRIPELQFNGIGNILLIGWGSYKGKIEKIHDKLEKEGIQTQWVCIDYINPLPKNIEFIKGYKGVIVIEGNGGQLYDYLSKYFYNTSASTKYTNITGNELNTKYAIEEIKNFINTL